MKPIMQFKDQYSWLSNMTPFEKPLAYRDGLIYITNEHFYMAMKTNNMKTRKLITTIENPHKVKRLSKDFKLVSNWEGIKLEKMLTGLRYKFSKNNPILRQKLIDTLDCYIEEGNYWNDEFWGINLKTGEGENHLGKLLMKVRTEIIEEEVKKIRKRNNG